VGGLGLRSVLGSDLIVVVARYDIMGLLRGGLKGTTPTIGGLV
jgi:hypothetical protein